MTYTAGEGVHCVLGSTHKGRYQFWSSDTQQPDDVKHVHFIIQCQLLHCVVTCAENTAPAHSVSIETTQIKKVTLRLSFRASKLILRSRPELCIGVYNDSLTQIRRGRGHQCCGFFASHGHARSSWPLFWLTLGMCSQPSSGIQKS